MMQIDVLKDGPYKVSGGVPLIRLELEANEDGDIIGFKETYRYSPEETGDTYMLCRCGESENKPFCDGAHVAGGFEDDSKAGDSAKFADRAEAIAGDGMDLFDANNFCIMARLCHSKDEDVWNLTNDSKAKDADPHCKKSAIHRSKACPSGRLVMVDVETEEVMEPELEPSIAIIEDPSRGVSSALWVRGDIPVYDSDGNKFEQRNRVTLCRCGESRNKPFCNGAHYNINFDDGHAQGESN